MNVSYFIARRYLSGKKRKTVVNWVTNISMIGIAVTTAALVILIAAFNGIESMVEKLYSEFDTDITIKSKNSKTFNEDFFPFEILKKTPGILSYAKTVEEVVILKHEKTWANARILGTENSLLSIIHAEKHLIDGDAFFREKNNDAELCIIGATLLDKLNAYIIEDMPRERISINAPKRNVKMRLGSNPFTSRSIEVAGRLNYNKEVNQSYILTSLEFGRDILGYDRDLSTIMVDLASATERENIQEVLQKKLGKEFDVKTSYQKNELIYQTSKSEKMIVIIILIFIFILATFNLIASLTLLFIEKKQDIQTLACLGADKKFMFRIFFFEGILICLRGVLIGLIVGVLVCIVQIKFQLLILPNSNGEAFPIVFSWKDGLLVLSIVLILSWCASYFPCRFLVGRHYAKTFHGSVTHAE